MIYSNLNGKSILGKKVRSINNNFIDLSNVDEIMASERLDNLYTISTEGDEINEELFGADLLNFEELEDQVIRLQTQATFDYLQESQSSYIGSEQDSVNEEL